MAAWTMTASRFEAVLAHLETEGVKRPPLWVEINLFDALGALAAHEYVEADVALDNLARSPTAQEVGNIKWTRDRLRVFEIRERFGQLKHQVV